jgi:hypothetical protein
MVTVLLPLDVVGVEDTLHWHTSPRHCHVPALHCTCRLTKASVLSPEDIANGLTRLDAVRGHGVSFPQHLSHELAPTRGGVSLRYVHAHGLQPTREQDIPPQPRIAEGGGGGWRGISARGRGGGVSQPGCDSPWARGVPAPYGFEARCCAGLGGRCHRPPPRDARRDCRVCRGCRGTLVSRRPCCQLQRLVSALVGFN